MSGFRNEESARREKDGKKGNQTEGMTGGGDRAASNL